jgi:hypothetical protein
MQGIKMNLNVENYKWDHEHVSWVREEKEKFRGDKDKENLLRMVTESAYSKETHYVLELIQNAEDEDSKNITFTITDNYILVENDGEPFSADDVFSICSAGQTRKENKIGFFGIGFKSVFNITKNPQIISGKYNFSVHEYIYPEPTNNIPDLVTDFDQSEGAFFMLPINAKRGMKGKDLARGLYEINERLLLFLRSLEKITFKDMSSKENRSWEITKENLGNGFIRINNSGSGNSSIWKVFDTPVKVPPRKELRVKGKENVVKTRVVIAFPHPEEKIDISAEGVYSFLPTEKRTDLPFLIQGDFIPTLGRENIEDNKWNRWLLKKIGELSSETFLKIRQDKVLGEHLYDFIPLPEQIPDQMIKVVPETIVKNLKKKKMANCGSSWELVQDAVLLDDDLTELITEKDLKEVFRRSVRKAWAGLDDRARKVLSELGIRKFGLQEMVRLLKLSRKLKRKRGQWFLDTYDYLRRKKQALWERKDIWDMFWNIKFLRRSTGELVAPRDSRKPYRLITHYPQKKEIGNLDRIFESGELVFLDKFFQVAKKGRKRRIDPDLEEKRKRVKDFLKEYDVEKYMEEFHIINRVVLESFTSGRYRRFKKKRLVIFTNFIRENLSLYANRIRGQRSYISEDEIYDDIKGKLLLKGFYFENGRRREGFFKPEELYFYKLRSKITDVFKLFKGVDGIPFLSQIYYDRKLVRGYSTVDPSQRRGRKKEVLSWDDFFAEMGVWASPRLLSRDIEVYPGDTKYEGIPFGDSSEGHTLLGDHYFPDIEELMSFVNGESQETMKAKMGRFLDLVARNWDKAYKKRIGSVYRRFYYKEYKHDVGYAFFINQMKELSWMPSENLSGLFRPEQCYIGTRENRLLLSKDTPFVPIRRDYRALYKAIGVNESPPTEHLMDHLIALKGEWTEESFPANWRERMEAIYNFLNNVLQRDKEGQESEAVLQKFQREELIFLPTEKRNWWRIREVYWKDIASVLSWMRGYLSSVYSAELEDFFRRVKVKDSPELEELVEILEEIKAIYEGKVSEEMRRELKGIIDPVYKEMSDQLKNNARGDAENGSLLKKEIFLTSDNGFVSPDTLVYCDSEKLRGIFGDKARIIWLRSDWRKLLPLFEEASIDSLSSRVRVKIVKENEREIPKEQMEALHSLSKYLGVYIIYFDADGYDAVMEKDELKRIGEMDIKLVSRLSLKSVFLPRGENRRFTVSEPNAEAFYDERDSTLYVLESEDWLESCRDAISEEIAKILKSTSLSLKTQVESLLSAGFDEESRNRKFASFGIPQNVMQDFIEPTEQKLKEGKKSEAALQKKTREETEESGADEDDVIDEKGEKEVTKKPGPSHTFEFKWEELISLDEITRFRFNRKGEPSVDIDIGRQRRKPKGKPKPGSGGSGGPSTFTKSIISKHETESRAIEIVKMYESEMGRDPNDVRKDGVGYDVDSSDRKIEVKSFKGSAGTIELYETEYDAAKVHGKNFYIYVVYNMLKESQPKIEIIKDPLNSVVFVAERRTAKNWKDSIVEEVDVLGKNEEKED